MLNPKPVEFWSIQSPSGRWVCSIDPSDIYGRGPAKYRVEKDGVVVWSEEKPFTLHEAGITDDGQLAGYAYSNGVRGFSIVPDGLGYGDFIVAIIGSRGEIRLNEATKREGSRYLHANPDPRARGLIVDGENDRLTVRVSDKDWDTHQENWWTYRLSSARLLDRVKRPVMMGASPIRGTPLTLLRFWNYPDSNQGISFVLEDLSRHEVWAFDLPRDDTRSEDDVVAEEAMDKVLGSGASLDSSHSNRFEILSRARTRRLMFEVSKDVSTPTGWNVKQTGNSLYVDLENRVERLPIFPVGALRKIGEVSLRDGAEPLTNLFENMVQPGFDDSGRIGFLQPRTGAGYRFVLADADGRSIHKTDLDVAEVLGTEQNPFVAWIEGDRWVLLSSESAIGAKASAWWLDALRGDLSRISGFDCPEVYKVTGTHDGGFAVLGKHRSKYSSDKELISFDKKGRARWSVGKGHAEAMDLLLSPEALSSGAPGHVTVLDNIRKTVQYFDSAGRLQRTVNLETAWGREPNYPTELASELGGGLVIYDFKGSPPLVTMGADDKVISRLTPKYTDGRLFLPVSSIVTSPSGSVWVCDGDSLARLDSKGKIDRILGRRPENGRLGDVGELDVDQSGRIYAADRKTGAVHVFDASGSRLRVCQPDVGDIDETSFGEHIGATPDGSVYLYAANDEFDQRSAIRYLLFDPHGKLVGLRRLGLDVISETWYPLPHDGNRLVLGYQDAWVVGGDDKVITQIKRGPDGKWLERPLSASVAPDGSFAIVGGFVRRSDTFWPVNLYSPSGDPVRTLHIPDKCNPYFFTYTGKYLITSHASEVCVFDVNGIPVLKFDPSIPGLENASGSCFTSMGGRELWLFLPERKSFYRYALN